MRKLLGILLLVALSLNSSAQERPKIGLALSGGGAKSMCHIGVLRELESYGIRPDYITGTSMGAIIGAMYAHGFSPDQIEKMLSTVDWEALLNNSIPRYHRSYLDRKSEDRYTFSLSVDSTGIGLPDALNSGQYVLSTLAYLFQEVHDDTVFTDFQIPFTCVGTDLETGEMIVFDHGDLPSILRASSAFPSIFSPYEINGRLLVDGGVRNNIPIELLKERGMDFIIASDAQATLYQREELTDMVTILEQVGSFPNMTYFEEQKKYADVIIHPPLESFNIVSYEFSDSIILLGEIETRKYKETLEPLGSSTPLSPLRPPFPQDSLFISSVSIIGNKETTELFIKSTLGIEENAATETKELRAGIEKLYGSNFYEHVDYRIHARPEGGHDLVVILQEKSTNQEVHLGVHYDDDFKIGVLFNLTVRNALLKNSKFSFDVVLSENPRGELSYIFERGFIPALGFKVDFHQFDSRVYVERNPVTEYTYTDFSTEIFIHSTLWDVYTIGGGVRLENIDISEPILRSEIQESNATYLNYFGFIEFDSFNRTYKPNSGFSLEGEIKLISEQVDFSTYLEPTSMVHLTYDQAYKFSDRWGGRTRVLGAATLGPDAPFPYSIFLGSMGENYTQHIFPFIGYRYMELFGRNALTLRADLWYEAFDNHFFTIHANVGKLEATFNDLFSSDVLLDGYGLSYGYNSAIGPLELFITKSTNHSDLLTYVRLGFWF
ncbi:MAG: patatin-like phospholipase family protein [Flavobacteriia bacterium]|nr:patatin-like phospholipase family protein [Flavobacteriia bacterium]